MIDVIRTAMTWVFVALATLIAVPALVIAGPDSPWIDRIARIWARVWLVALGLRPVVEGADRVDPNGSYVVVGNHQSNLDPMCHFLAFPAPLRFLAKKELYSVPLFGSAIRAAGMIRVDRDRPSMSHINDQVNEAVERGKSIIVYGEGTRSKTGELGSFKKGPFVIAIQTGLPIVPAAITGTNAIWPPGAKLMHPGPIALEFGDPIPTTGLTLDDVDDLRSRVREWIANALRV
jgi:1-acyl-sn-glycerol-3-phosphate acyltransferase